MKQVDAFLLVLLLILGAVAFLNFGNVSLASGPGGVGFGAGFKRQ
jgi:hypothetical protein